MRNKRTIPTNCGNHSISEQDLRESTEMFYNWGIMATKEQLMKIQQDQIIYYQKAAKNVKAATNVFDLEYNCRLMQRTLEVINKAERLMDYYGFEYVPFVPYC